jgi:3-carboxy-cis,cis-muconate cycloisomerase
MEELLACLKPDAARMRRNLALSGELIAAENAMMALAPAMGREAAHHAVHDAAHEAMASGAALSEILLRDAAVRAALPAEKLREALDPARYTGQSAPLARQCAGLARAAAGRCRVRASG